MRLWIEKETSTKVAYAYITSPSGSNTSPTERFVEIEDSLIPKKAINAMSHKPLAIPKLKVTDESIIQYRKASALGYISILKFENTIFNELVKEEGRETDDEDEEFFLMENMSIEDLTELLNETVELENYELAALLRDQIRENLEKKDSNQS